DGVADLIDISVPNNPAGTKYQFLITDSLNRLFYAPFENQLINFDNTPAGNYRVYGVAYTGTLGFQLGANILNNTLINACFDLSDNYLEIYHNKPEAGQISKKDGTTTLTVVTANNNQKDSILLKVTNVIPINVPYSFVLVNNNNLIVSAHHEAFNLDTLKIGKYRIFGVASSSPNLSLSVGKSFSDIGKAENCILISSNFLEVDIISTSSSPIVNNILIATDAPEKAKNISLSAFPNPVNDVLNVQIRQTLNKSDKATLRLTHISGKILFELNTNLEKGEQLLTIPMAMYPAGLYILTVEAGEIHQTSKIIKAE
ncbi:MAG: T9SS type A sorting domain-containing protein, partial [Saprospiraceae bacterium]|nr:T9SS type A sorting domain-containing protein [Saprospiraceae bacterium]